MNQSTTGPSQETTTPAGRRNFLARFAAMAIGAVVAIFPFAAGWGVLTYPLRRRDDNDAGPTSGEDHFVRVTRLDTLPADGRPRPFVVTADASDAWTRTPAQRIGMVFLTRTDGTAGPEVSAISSVCPHLGCAIEFSAAAGRFECPCHESAFAIDGEMLFGPSLRGLDPLEVKLVGAPPHAEVWVAYKNFRTGLAERIPVA